MNRVFRCLSFRPLPGVQCVPASPVGRVPDPQLPPPRKRHPPSPHLPQRPRVHGGLPRTVQAPAGSARKGETRWPLQLIFW